MPKDPRLAVRPPPHLVVASAPDELVARRRSARGGRAAKDEGPVEEDPCGLEVVEVCVRTLRHALTVEQRDEPAPELARRLRVHPTEEVPGAVRLVLGHQRRPGTGEAVADRRELCQRRPGREPDVVVGERVRPQDAAGDRAERNGRLDTPALLEEDCTPHERGQQERRRGRRHRLAVDPGRAGHDQDEAADEQRRHIEEQRPSAATPGEPQTAGRRHGEHGEQNVGRAEVGRRKPEVGRRPDAKDLEAVERARSGSRAQSRS